MEPITDNNSKEITLVAEDAEIKIAPGKRVKTWTFNGTVPAPTLRFTEGDNVTIHFINKSPIKHKLILSLSAEKAFGGQGVIILSLIALFATSNTALMMLISGSRIIYGISKDQSFPKTLAVVHKSRKTPWVAIIIVMVSTMTIVAWSSGDIATIASIAVFGIFLVYAIVNLSLIWSRFNDPGYKRPFVSPIRIGKFPVLAGMGLIASVAMLLA